MQSNAKESVKQVPQNFGPFKGFDAHVSLKGPCGDTVGFYLKGEGSRITKASFISDGDQNSFDLCSLIAQSVEGKSIEEAKNIDQSSFKTPTASECVAHALDVMSMCVGRVEVALSRKEKRSKAPPSEGRRTLMVMSGKGGVGKSTVAVNIALSLAAKGLKVGLVDVDIHGPSIPTMLNIKDVAVMQSSDGIQPVILGDMYNLEVMSVGFLLHNDDDPVVWRGPLKHSIIDQFLNEVAWGPLDYLIVDAPPGTGDEPLSVAQKLEGKGEALLVTTPQQVSSVDVARSINFCSQMGISIVGLIENMVGFVCPHCHTVTNIFRSGGGEELAKKYDIPLLGSIPIDPSFSLSGDTGVPYVTRFNDSPSGAVYRKIVDLIDKGEEV